MSELQWFFGFLRIPKQGQVNKAASVYKKNKVGLITWIICPPLPLTMGEYPLQLKSWPNWQLELSSICLLPSQCLSSTEESFVVSDTLWGRLEEASVVGTAPFQLCYPFLTLILLWKANGSVEKLGSDLPLGEKKNMGRWLFPWPYRYEWLTNWNGKHWKEALVENTWSCAER